MASTVIGAPVVNSGMGVGVASYDTGVPLGVSVTGAVVPVMVIVPAEMPGRGSDAVLARTGAAETRVRLGDGVTTGG